MKKALSVILALALIFSIPSVAFSAESGDTIIRVDSDGYETAYEYGGELVLGSNEITFPTDNKRYFIFTPDRDGIYALTTGHSFFDVAKDCENNTFSEFADYVWFYESSSLAYRFTAGERQFICFDTYNLDCSLKIEYLGEIENVELEEKDKLYLLGEDIYSYEDGSYLLMLWFELTFSESDKKFSTLELKSFSAIESGATTVAVDCFGKEFNLNIRLMCVEDYLAYVSLPDNYKPFFYQTYGGRVIGNYPNYITAHYTDGTEEQLKLDSIQEVRLNSFEQFGLPEIDGWVEFDESGHLWLTIADTQYDLHVDAKQAGWLINTAYLLSRIRLNIVFSLFELPMYIFTQTDPISYLSSSFIDLKDSIAEEIRMYKESL